MNAPQIHQQPGSKGLFGDVISEAAREAFEACCYGELAVSATNCDIVGEQIYAELGRSSITSDELAEEIINRLGYCFTRIGGKLVVED